MFVFYTVVIIVKIHWIQKVVTLTNFSSMPPPDVVRMTTSNSASDEKIVNMTTFWFRCIYIYKQKFVPEGRWKKTPIIIEQEEISNCLAANGSRSNVCVPNGHIWFMGTVHHRRPLRWRHNDHDSVSNHQPHDCLLNRLFRRSTKNTSQLRVTGLSVGNSPGTGEFPAQMASNKENGSIWWRHHACDCSYWVVAITRFPMVVHHDRWVIHFTESVLNQCKSANWGELTLVIGVIFGMNPSIMHIANWRPTKTMNKLVG